MSRRPRLGTYVCIDDQLFAHPKIHEVGPIASALYQAMIQHCGNRRTDGFVANGYVPFLLPPEWLGRISVDGESIELKHLLEHLLQAELLHAVDGGYLVHDFLDWNLSRSEIDALRESKQAAGRKGGLTRAAKAGARASALPPAQTTALPPAQASGGGSASSKSQADTDTDTDTDTEVKQVGSEVNPLSQEGGVGGDEPSGSAKLSPKPKAVGAFEADFDELWAIYPRKKSRLAALKAYQARRKGGATAEDLIFATQRYAEEVDGQDLTFVKLGSTFFGPAEHWREYLAGGAALAEAAKIAKSATPVLTDAQRAWHAYKKWIKEPKNSPEEVSEFPTERIKHAAYATFTNWRDMLDKADWETTTHEAIFIEAWEAFGGDDG